MNQIVYQNDIYFHSFGFFILSSGILYKLLFVSFAISLKLWIVVGKGIFFAF